MERICCVIFSDQHCVGDLALSLILLGLNCYVFAMTRNPNNDFINYLVKNYFRFGVAKYSRTPPFAKTFTYKCNHPRMERASSIVCFSGVSHKELEAVCITLDPRTRRLIDEVVIRQID